MKNPIKWYISIKKEMDRAYDLAIEFCKKPRALWYPTPEELFNYLVSQGINKKVALGIVKHFKNKGEVREKCMY